jgi:hypothetical protein
VEAIYRDYAPKGVKFYYLYKSLAHPELLGYVGPVTFEERLMHIQEAKRTLGSEITWLCDTMSNDLKHAIGDASNSEYVLDPHGKIVRMRNWSNPDLLRKDLETLVGPVSKPTTIADLHMKVEPPPKNAPTGIVPRLKLEAKQFLPLKTEAHVANSKQPFYVKLRAEGDRNLVRTGNGKLYLGFFLDPLYHVHWNNEVAPVQYEIVAPKGVSVSPAKAAGPKVKEPADADPREFLLEVNRGSSKEPVTMKLHYFGCTDVWCVPLTQEYLISWDVDRDGGWRIEAGQLDPREFTSQKP